MAILNRFFFYAIMNVVIYFMTNDCYLPNFEQSLFGTDRFIFHADGLFLCTKKYRIVRPNESVFPFALLLERLNVHNHDNKKR